MQNYKAMGTVTQIFVTNLLDLSNYLQSDLEQLEKAFEIQFKKAAESIHALQIQPNRI